jgi:hypothetical protein
MLHFYDWWHTIFIFCVAYHETEEVVEQRHEGGTVVGKARNQIGDGRATAAAHTGQQLHQLSLVASVVGLRPLLKRSCQKNLYQQRLKLFLDENKLTVNVLLEFIVQFLVLVVIFLKILK